MAAGGLLQPHQFTVNKHKTCIRQQMAGAAFLVRVEFAGIPQCDRVQQGDVPDPIT